MNRELKRVSVLVLVMFLALFISSTIIQFLEADSLNADARNTRSLAETYKTQRGAVIIDGDPVASSTPVDDRYRYQRSYSNGPLYAPVTGYFTVGDQGSTGIEAAMNSYLSGTSDSQFFDQINSLLTGQDPSGAAVELSIDPAAQRAALTALGDQRGAVIAIEPATGRILAMVSTPTYDPNALASHDTAKVIDRYNTLLAAEGDPLINRTIAGDLYFPGSTFKLIDASAALESGDYTMQSRFDNLSSLPLPQSDSAISNAGGGTCGSGDKVTIYVALQYSCNIPMAQLGMELGDDALRQMAELYGFGQTIEVPMAATPSTYPAELDAAQTALTAIGQYDVRVTPLQIAMVTSSIANDGELMQPTLVDRVISPDLTTLEETQPTVFSRPTSTATANAITEAMVASVTSGAATNARIDGVEVAGKTGTAENGEGQPYTLWFTGFAPADDPQVAVAVVVENGAGQGQATFGNAVAAPIARAVIEAVLNE